MTITLLTLEELQRGLAERPEEFCLVDARGRATFLAGHLPGATWASWQEWCAAAPPECGPVLQQPGYWGLIDDHDLEQLAARLVARGIRSDRQIVVYDEGPLSHGRAGRIAWMLLYLGAPRVALLDGTWNHWLGAGYPIEVGEGERAPGYFALHQQPQRRVRLAELAAAYRAGALPTLLDTRRPDDFSGRREPYLPRRGHLPGAALVPFLALFDEEDHFLGREEYLALLPPAARDGGAVVTYCEVGVRASTVALLHELHTGQIVPVFDGSLMEWGLAGDLPVERDDALRG